MLTKALFLAENNLSELSRLCQIPITNFIDEYSAYHFVDNHANILGVAHLDTVQQLSGDIIYDDGKLYNSGWDDRIGLYTLIYALPHFFNIKLDWLFTMDEEQGRSTAYDFVQDYLDQPSRKTYRWIIEFDRAGTDIALYDYRLTRNDDTDVWLQAIEATFPAGIARGTYTDICEMQPMGIKAMNIGSGYHHAHSPHAYIVPEEYVGNINHFANFYRQYQAKAFTHKPKPLDKQDAKSRWRNP